MAIQRIYFDEPQLIKSDYVLLLDPTSSKYMYMTNPPTHPPHVFDDQNGKIIGI